MIDLKGEPIVLQYKSPARPARIELTLLTTHTHTHNVTDGICWLLATIMPQLTLTVTKAIIVADFSSLRV